MALANERTLGTVEIAATTSSIAGWVNQVDFHHHFYAFFPPKILLPAKGTFPARWASTSPVNRVAAEIDI